METIKVLGVEITQIDSKQLNSEIVNVVKGSGKVLITNVNIHCMNLSYRSPELRKILNDAFINFCDGDGVRLAAWILGKRIIEKITYNRWIWEIARVSEKEGITWYLVGSRETVVREAARKLNERYPNLQIVGYHHGFLKDEVTKSQVAEEIRKVKPNLLVTGMGMPIQEKWLSENFEDLPFKVGLTGGAVFEYVSGNAKMTPKVFYELKLEWFYRFLQEPGRLFKRYFIGNPLFIVRVVGERLGILRF